MPNWIWNVTDATTGKSVANAEVNVTVSTTPCPKVLGVPQAGCTSGPGYEILVYSDAGGQATSTIPYTCRQDIVGTIDATGYNSYPQQYGSGSITGDVAFDIQLTPASASGTAGELSNSAGGSPQGQGVEAVTTEGAQAGTNLSTEVSTWWSGAFGELETGGIIVAVVVVAVAIIGLIVLIVLH